ncbi:MAG: hypothetical protein WD847_06405 [Pirellulales bacterium]
MVLSITCCRSVDGFVDAGSAARVDSRPESTDSAVRSTSDAMNTASDPSAPIPKQRASDAACSFKSAARLNLNMQNTNVPARMQKKLINMHNESTKSRNSGTIVAVQLKTATMLIIANRLDSRYCRFI